MLEPKLAILDETDSGLDIDALRTVAEGVNTLKRPDNATIVVTHYQRLLDYIVPDYVHVLFRGRIVKSGTKEPFLEEAENLADAYLAAGVVPEKNFNDALHVAITTIHEFDVLLSWNFRHLANINKEARFMEVNCSKGYLKPFKITTPYEVSA